MIIDLKVFVPDDYAAVLVDDDADIAQEVADLLRFRIARLLSMSWERDTATVVGGDGHELEEAAVGAHRYVLAEGDV